MPPRVVVVTPCYGQAHLLPDAAGSVAEQTFRDLEYVIVDDGSPDDTAVVAERLMERYPDLALRLVRQENRGLAEARNTGIRSSEAPLILPLDSDDRLAPAAVERMVAAFDARPELSVVGCWGREFGDSDDPLRPTAVPLRRLLKGNEFLYASMYRREAYARAGGYNANMKGGFEDWDFWISMLEQGAAMHIVEEELFLYRKSGASMINSADARDLWLRARIVLNHPRLFEEGRVRLAEKTVGIPDPRRPGAWLRLRWIWYFLKDLNRKQVTRQIAAMFA